MSNKHHLEDNPDNHIDADSDNQQTVKRHKENDLSTFTSREFVVDQVKSKCVEFASNMEIQWDELHNYLSQIPGALFNQRFMGDDSDQTLLMYFINLNWSKGISFVLAQKGIDLNVQNNCGSSALHIACDKKEIDLLILEILLENGANPNLFDTRNTSPLYLILRGHVFNSTHFNAVQLLTRKYKAELNIEPININADYASGNCLNILSNRQNFEGAFILPAVQFLIENGALVNFQNTKSKRTPLIQCMAKFTFCVRRLEYIELLIRNNADLNVQDVNGNTALHWACFTPVGLRQIELLLSRGANPNLFNISNATPLYYILIKINFKPSDLEAVGLLVKNKADLNKESTAVDTTLVDGNCLHMLCNSRNFDCPSILAAIQFVIESGADINFRNQTLKETPLMRACFESSNDSKVKYVQLLIENKANINLTDASGDTALDLLYQSNELNPQIAKLLIKNGANCIETYRRYILNSYYGDNTEMLAILVGEIFQREPDEAKRKQILFHPSGLAAAHSKLIRLLKYYDTRTNQQNFVQTIASANGSNALLALVLKYV